MVLSAVSDPVQLVKIMATLLGVAFVGLLVVNSVSLAGTPRPLPRRSSSDFVGLSRPKEPVVATLEGPPSATCLASVSERLFSRRRLAPAFGCGAS